MIGLAMGGCGDPWEKRSNDDEEEGDMRCEREQVTNRIAASL